MTAASTDRTPVSLRARAVAEHPLTRTQQLIWTSQRLAPAVPLANMGKLHRISGPLDPDRFAAAFDRVVDASSALRTVVADVPGREPAARVLANPPATTEVVDLPPDEVDRWAAERIGDPIDATTCCYDSVLLRHADDSWTWWLDLHHVVTDASAAALVFDRVSAAYESDTADIDDPGLYEFVAQATATDPEAQHERARFWASLPDDGAPITPYGPRGTRTTRVDRVPVEVSPEIEGALGAGPYRTLSRELSLLALLATTTAAALSRLDGRSSITLAVPIHHRSGQVAPRVIGPLMELYPLRVDVESGESFEMMFQRVYRSIVTVLRHAKPGESPDASYDAVINVLTARYGQFAGMPTATDWARSGHVEAAHPIRVQAYDYGDGLRLELDLNGGLSADGAHQRLPSHLGRVLDAAVRRPEQQVSDVDIVTDEERAVLDALNPPAPDGPALRPVHLAIADRLRDDPGAVVAEHDDEQLTAGELDRRAAALARHFVGLGAVRGSRIGLRLPRSPDVLVAIHGVLRAGAAFVMLDPDDPAERHERIADDAELLTILDEVPRGLADHGQVDADTGVEVDLDDLAYVLYTSGSTGVPKGVPISHRGLADYLRFAVAAYPTTGPMVMPLHSSLVFDLTITSLFLPQLVGGRTVVVDGDALAALSAVAARSDLTVLKATPSQLELLIRMIDEPAALEVVIVGGEALRRPVAAAFTDACRGDVRIFNEYGPTEAVVGCTVHEWRRDDDLAADVPIGLACPGAEAFVLDTAGRRAVLGAWGELYVRRPGMATGYLNLPELSAERFSPVIDDQPLYRTGDRVRVADGVLVYGGRNDDQLKVGGVRLEPGEVEAALVEHPNVSKAVVRIWTPGRARIRRCQRCGLGTDVPGIVLDADVVCTTCREFEHVEPRTRTWFKTPADLDARRDAARARARGEYDCLHLLSGGKDSTYALYQLVERGWRVHALTLDNGYISDGAKQNVARSVADLGISHEFVTTEAMNDIFRDSLERFANVCNGCYKTIYTLATARAHELGIPVIVTGLSRGQFFETRLVPHQFEAERFDPEAIDRTVLQARRAYHHTTDAVTELLPEQRVFGLDEIDVLDEIEYVDFYRYVDVELAELYDFLERRAPWVRPADTGRSTNCLVNAAGIHVHTTERGYHNYAEPYSWDVRLGHKTRGEALEELDDDLDLDDVQRMLDEIGYAPKRTEVLTAWYQTIDGQPLDPNVLRAFLRERLPERLVPTVYVEVGELPLADSAKLDVAALPPPPLRLGATGAYVAPATPTEAVAADVWAMVLGVERVGRNDDFFDLGGASLAALETIAALEQRLGVGLPDALVFAHRVLHEFAAAADTAAADGAGHDEIPALDLDEPLPLSPTEAGMLFEYRSRPADTRYNVTRLYTIDDDVDDGRLHAALRDVVSRHAPLHVAFDADRTVLPVDTAVSFEPMADGPADEFADRQRRVPFDLDHGPLVRVHVGHDRPGTTDVLIAMHHLSIDAGTFDTFWDEVEAAYHGRPLPELLTSVAAHGEWQRRRSASDAEFWDAAADRSELAGEARLPVPAAAEPDGYLELAAPVSTAELATVAATTPFAASLAAAALVLGAHSRTGAVELGITASTKDHPDATPLVGYFLNTLPVLIDVDRDATVRTVDERAGEIVATLLPHRSFPLTDIVRRCRERGAVPPDVSHMLAYERLAPARWGDGEARHRIFASGVSVSEITFFVQERGDQLHLGVEYRGNSIARSDAQRLLTVFGRTLDAICRQPSTTVADIDRWLAGDDLVGPDLPPAPSVIERFIEHATASPGAPAVVAPDGTVSYGELHAGAGRLAARMSDAAPSPRRVGVAVSRSSTMVEAMLAAHLAGASYVPIDPDVPRRRLETIVEHAQPDVIVTDDAERLDDLAGDTPILLIADTTDATTAEIADEFVPPAPADEAYVIFTSGSTGVPAGVPVTHGALAASTAARSEFYAEPPERFLLTSSIGFDSSLVGLCWPLATGGTVVVPGDDVVHDVDRLGELVATESVTHLLMVPSLYRAVLERRGGLLTALRTAIVAGEACPAGLVALHHDVLPGVDLVNEYGPTEAAVWAAAHQCLAGDDPVPIGRPIAGVRLRVADAQHRPMATGAAGELLIAGPGVADGYLGDRSSEAFTTADGERWYCTGDLVRVGGDRNLHFLGRIDDQLNVGGVRVEPTEIEAILTELDDIADAVVVAASIDGRESLVAHVIAAPDLDVAAVRRDLADRLVGGALPRRIIAHDDLPRTEHGKLDRRRASTLPIVSVGTDDGSAGLGAEHLDDLVAVWRRALGNPGLGTDADFFAAGGDSLAAVELVTLLADLAGHDVPVTTLLAAPTPAAMADRLGMGRPQAAAAVQLVTLRPGDPEGALVVMTAAWDDVQGYRALADSFGDDVTVVAIAVADDRDDEFHHVPRLVDTSLDLLGDDLRQRRPLAVVGWSIGGVVAYELAQTLHHNGAHVDTVALVDTYFPGEQEHLWSNRWWKYKSMLRPGSFGAALGEARTMLLRRVKRKVAKVGRALVAWAGETPPRTQVRARTTTPGGIPFVAMDHTPTPGPVPMVLYAADTTNPKRTEVPWRAVSPELEVVRLEGRHRGHDSIMGADRVHHITDDLTTRLRS